MIRTRRLSMRDFIRENRGEIDAAIKGVLNYVPSTASCSCPKSGTEHYHDDAALNDTERRDWIMNDEGLYNWARSEGVRV